MVSLDRILCPVDLSDCSLHALAHAAAIAAWYESRLAVMHVLVTAPVLGAPPSFGASTIPSTAVDEADRAAHLEALQQFIARAVGDSPLETTLVDGPDPRHEILAQARAFDANLLVMGTHGRTGVDHVLLGSVTEKVLRKASCPVLVVPRDAGTTARPNEPPFKRILCPVDFSESSIRALAYAFDLAEEADARISLLHVVEVPRELSEFPFTGDLDLDRIRVRAESKYAGRLGDLVPPEAQDYCSVAIQVSEGRAHREILRVAANGQSDLIVMGVQGRGAVDLALFGSNTHSVIRGSRCPVLTVPA